MMASALLRLLFIVLVIVALPLVPDAERAIFAQDPTETDPKVIEVVARRFEFEPSTIEVTEGERVRLLVRSADGPHGVEIKQFKVKKAVPRAKPGDEPVTIEFMAATDGTFPILCSEYCWSGHNDMKGTLVVQARPKGAQ